MSDETVVDPRPPSRLSALTKALVDGGPTVALLALLVAFAAMSPKFATAANFSTLLSQISILLVIGTGLTFVILLGSIDLSIEGVMATSSLVFVLLAANDRNSVDLGYTAVVAGVLAGTLFGLFNGALHVYLKIPSFMVTLGMGAIGIGIATVLFGGRSPQLMDPDLRAIVGGRTLGISHLVLVAALVLAMGFFIERYTRAGRYVYSIGGDETVVRLSGVNIERYKMVAFVLAGTASGLAGVLAAMQLGVAEVSIGSGYLFTAITAVVLGGTMLWGGSGSVVMTLVGASIITVLANGLILIGVSPYVQAAIQGIVIVVAVVVTGWSMRKRVREVK